MYSRKLDGICKKDPFRTVSNVQDGNVYYGIINIAWSLNMLCDRNMQGFWIWQGYIRFRICVSMLLNNALICLTMHEAEPKITVQSNVVLIDA